VCLGAQARAANAAARRQYAYQNERRERQWMQDLNVYQQRQVQYDINTNNAEMAAQAAYGESERKRQEARAKAELKYQDMYAELLNESKSAKLMASGRTGRSIARIKTTDIAAYGREVANIGRKLRMNDVALAQENAKAAAEVKSYKDQQFAQIAFTPTPDVAPPKPVMQSVGAAAFMDALSIAGNVAGIYSGFTSDRRLKENIQKIGESISGLGIYKFNYIGKTKQYIGAMADEVIKVVPEAVVTMDNGYLGVNYNLIDIDFKRL